MSEVTQHYQLHQWEAGDHFLRTDFNEDFSKIDAGIHGALATAQNAAGLAASEAGKVMDALMPVSYNVYNLMLQSYYEGKETGYRRGLLFDGFLNPDGIDRITGGGYDRTNRCLSLDAPIETGDFNYQSTGMGSGSPGVAAYQRFLCSRSGRLNYIHLRGGQQSYNTNTVTVQVSVVEWDKTTDRPTDRVIATSSPVTFTPVPNPMSAVMSFPISCQLDAGHYGLRPEVVSSTVGGIGLAQGRSTVEPPAYDRNKSQTPYVLCYATDFTATPSSSATLYTRPVSGGISFQKAVAYVRHGGGIPALSLKTGSVLRPMTRESSQNVTRPTGQRCTETRFTLDLGSSAVWDPISLQLTFTTGWMYDYGVNFF